MNKSNTTTMKTAKTILILSLIAVPLAGAYLALSKYQIDIHTREHAPKPQRQEQALSLNENEIAAIRDIATTDCENFYKNLYALLDTRTNSAEMRKLQRESISSLNGSIRDGVVGATDKAEMYINITPYFAHWIGAYMKLIRFVQSQGYAFKSLDDFTQADIGTKTFFLRYDIHPKDIPSTYGFFFANLLLEVPGDFYLNWRYSDHEIQAEEEYLLLKRARNKYVHFGLHTAPVEGYILKNTADTSDLSQLVSTPERVKELVAHAEQELAAVSADFKRHFPEAKTCSGHGTPLLRGLVKDPRFHEIAQTLVPDGFLTPDRINPLGYNYESMQTSLSDPGLAFVGDGLDERFVPFLLEKVAQGKTIFCLIHPHNFQFMRRSFEMPASPVVENEPTQTTAAPKQ